jgi:alkanesulfonate monooxygenase
MPLHPSIRRPIEFIGFMGAAPFSEVEEANGGPALQPEYVEALAVAHEAGDFDRVLIGYGADSADGWQIGAYMAQRTERLGMLVAHRPGFVQPTLAARFASSLDVFSKGRVAMHMITGGSDEEIWLCQRVCDGQPASWNFFTLAKVSRYWSRSISLSLIHI